LIKSDIQQKHAAILTTLVQVEKGMKGEKEQLTN